MKKTKKAPKKYKKRTTTPRQSKAKSNMLEKCSSQGEALRDAGYSKGYSEQPSRFAKTKAGQDLISVCNDLRDKSLAAAAKKIADAKYGELTKGADTLNKMSRLEDNKSTEILTIEDLIAGKVKED